MLALSLPIELVSDIDKLVKKDTKNFRNRSHCFSMMASAGLKSFKETKETDEFLRKLFGG